MSRHEEDHAEICKTCKALYAKQKQLMAQLAKVNEDIFVYDMKRLELWGYVVKDRLLE